MASTTQELSSKDLLEAQSHLWNHTFSFINSLSLKCAVELGIADAINNHGKPITLTELTSALSIPPVRIQNFQRLMTLLVHNGYFTVSNNPADSKEEDVYGLTNNSVILVREMGASIAPFIELALDSTLMDSWQTLSSWFKSETPSTAFEKYHGMYVWEAAGKMPEFGKKLRDGFESDSAAVAKVVIEDHGGLLQGINSVVEVAGRTGGLALAIAKAFPHIKCTVLDLAHIIDNIDVKHHMVDHVKGDMFKYIPPADVVILKWVLITWNDEECVKILKRCKEAVPTKVKGGKVMVIDKVFNTSDGVDRKIAETQLFFDMQVMVQTTGKVRTEAELKKIFTAAGFKEYKIIPALGMRSVIEIYH